MNFAKLFLFDIDTDLLLVLYLGIKMVTTLGFENPSSKSISSLVTVKRVA